MRLNPVMQSIIHQDQTGFIHVQQLSNNLRILFNILYSQGSLQLPEVLFSLDVQKAFDHIEYEYCFKALRNCGFGSSFCTWISILYTHPADCIRTYRVISDYFCLYRVQDRAAPRKQTTNKYIKCVDSVVAYLKLEKLVWESLKTFPFVFWGQINSKHELQPETY